jgi:hypothetical protein
VFVAVLDPLHRPAELQREASWAAPGAFAASTLGTGGPAHTADSGSEEPAQLLGALVGFTGDGQTELP